MTLGEGRSGEVGQRDLDAVRAGYERWNSGDMAGLTELFAKDIEYHNSPEWPGQAVYRGADEVANFLETEVAEIIALRPVEIVNTDVLGNEILIELRARTLGSLSGLDLTDGSLFHVASMEGGKVSRVRVYLHKDEARRAAETSDG